MSVGYGINPIGYGLGTLGLGSTGAYGSSYYDSMMSGMSGYSPYSMGMGGMMGIGGMMGMYNPSYMRQMNQLYMDMESDQLQHGGAMHNLKNQVNRDAYISDDLTAFEKGMVDNATNEDVVLLAKKIREGDAQGVCEQYDKLKRTLYAKYNDYFKNSCGDKDPRAAVNGEIKKIYQAIISKNTGEQVDLDDDIKKYCESAFSNGFWKSFNGEDYPDMSAEDVLSYVNDTRIFNKAGKERVKKLGSGTEKVV